MKQHSPKAQAHLVELWNSRHPIGTAVDVRKDNDEVVRPKTRSEAQLLGGRTAVVFLEGISGCYMLTRCSPI
jgi:hypothetical protein